MKKKAEGNAFAAENGITHEGLTCEEELDRLCERFEMTREQLLKHIIHDVYITGISYEHLQKALNLEVAQNSTTNEENHDKENKEINFFISCVTGFGLVGILSSISAECVISYSLLLFVLLFLIGGLLLSGLIYHRLCNKTDKQVKNNEKRNRNAAWNDRKLDK